MTKAQQTSTDTMSVDKHYVKQQAKWVREVNLKEGDKVLVLTDCAEFRQRHADMLVGSTTLPSKYIGATLTVSMILDDRITVTGPRHDVKIVPFYALIKINE